MNFSKIMLSASIAAMALVSCNKADTTPEMPKRLKTVEISLENVALTKGMAGNKLHSGDAVILKDFKIFLTDAAGNEYNAKVANGSESAKSYWNAADLSTGPVKASFHYVDPSCTKVIAIGNLGKDITFAEYKALENIKVETQQEQDKLVLYDIKDLEKVTDPQSGTHNDTDSEGNTYVTDVYKADLVLAPRISRFEVDGFTIRFHDNPKYNEIKITQIAFQNYYPETSVATGNEAGALVNHITNLKNQAEVYTWLDDATKPDVWYRDYFDLTLTPATPENPTANTKDTPDPLAYHIFSCDEAPVMVIKLLADGQPAYLYSKGFKLANGTPVTSFEEGKIYRMVARGEVENDGSIAIDEDDIDPMDRCLEITVDVIDWTIDFVFPEF